MKMVTEITSLLQKKPNIRVCQYLFSEIGSQIVRMNLCAHAVSYATWDRLKGNRPIKCLKLVLNFILSL